MSAAQNLAAFKAHFVENWHEPLLLGAALLLGHLLGVEL